jgi:hypothetical protein
MSAIVFYCGCRCSDAPDEQCATVFIHQSVWQQRMLCRYGNYITLIDATYKTNVYDMPLFMLSVPTNAGYVVVASFLLVDEQATSITEALRTLSKWNPDWRPQFVMSDFSEAQIAAFESVFPGTLFPFLNANNIVSITRQ